MRALYIHIPVLVHDDDAQSSLLWQEIHQTKGFTKVWWTLKCALFPLTTTLLLVFLCKTRGRQRVLIERTLAYMGGAVAFMGGEE